jgi:RsiW-degrading membrane proteinase PrsW (M82 family)
MIYIENIFVCIAAPLLVATISMGENYYHIFLFFIAGMGACLLSAYINSFFARVYNADLINTTTQIAPVVEEIMKLMPLLFYLLVFEPKPGEIKKAMMIIAAGFATFENICCLMQSGADQLSFLLIRGFGTGAMHIVCGAIAGYGLMYVWQRSWLKIPGTFGLLCAAITYHAVYNLLIAHSGTSRYFAYGLPIFTIAAGMAAHRLLKALPHHETLDS